MLPPRAVWAFFEAPPGNSLRTAWRRLALGVATVVQGPFVSSKVMTRSGRRRGVSVDSLGGEMCGPWAREETGPCSGAVGCTQEGGVECSRKNGDVVYAASSWMCLNPSSYSCGVK